MSADTFTRWAIVASGEGGGRIASQFFSRTENPGIENRILVMNTNRNDLRNTIDRMEQRLAADDDLWDSHALEFGSEQGAGNFFPDGEACAREDFGKIVGRMARVFDIADAFMHVMTLGGGTGNGSIPYVVDQFSGGIDAADAATEPWMDSVIHSAFAVWPYENEPPQRHFNAVCGLSRLLRTAEGSQNADMVLLASNSHLAEDDAGRDYDGINEAILEAIDLLIGAGRRTHGVIDIKDYVTLPSQLDAYHFTPAVATGLNSDVFELEYMFERAAENAYVPMDPATTRAAYAIVRAPEHLIESERLTEPAVYSAFDGWMSETGINAPSQVSLTPTEGRGSEVDVMLLLGGFDLRPLLATSRDEFDLLAEGLAGGDDGLTQREIDRIESNLDEYVERSEG